MLSSIHKHKFDCPARDMQSPQEKFARHSGNDFALSNLKGCVGRAIVEYYLCKSGYEIYPHGYENLYANTTRGVSRADSDTTTSMLRRMPDLLVYDRDKKKSYLLEVKTRGRSNYWINKNDLDTYKKYWSEAILVIYCVQTQEVYCRKIAEINTKVLPTRYFSKERTHSYLLDLKDFKNLSAYFQRVKPEEYPTLRGHAIDVLKELNLQCDKRDPY